MKIRSAAQLHAWDDFTIHQQQCTREALIKRAASACFDWLAKCKPESVAYEIFCGKGNNGADGIALALMLIKKGCDVKVYILENGKTGSDSFQYYLQELHEQTTNIHFLQPGVAIKVPSTECIIIDAMFGSGLNKPLEGIAGEVLSLINNFKNFRIAIDIPSGMYADKTSKGNSIFKADVTLTFQSYKMALLMAENSPYFGRIILLDIGLSSNFEDDTGYDLFTNSMAKAIYRPRSSHSHKGNYGHAAVVAGSEGMMGAAVLAARACLATGAGKLTCIIPSVGYNIMQTAVPEAMTISAGEKTIDHIPGLQAFTVAAVGPGLSTTGNADEWLGELITRAKMLVLDADALNIIGEHLHLLTAINKPVLLTPHPKEFDRLFGSSGNDFERHQKAVWAAKEYNVYIHLKSHHSFTCTPFGKGYFNSSGNAGMAKAGMGDVLTGIMTGLLSSGYALPEAALLGAYLHGVAGDKAAEMKSQEALTASDCIDNLGKAWLAISSSDDN